MTETTPAPMTANALSELRHVRHGFFTREGGVSDGIYASLNCGLGSGDTPEAIVENRRRVAGALIGPSDDASNLLTAYQIHSATAILVNEPWSEDNRPKADGLVTTTPGLAVGVLTADCGPVLFADETHGVVGAAHAGWQGALGGVLEATVAMMETAGANRSSIRAVVGPTISQMAYEVGEEFQNRFLAQDPQSERFFAIPAGGTRSHFDLPSFISARLSALDLGSVSTLSTCTYAHETDFFSFRRTTHSDEPDYGRQISAIVLA